MTAQQHLQIKEILGDALECDPAERAALLDSRCDGDASLRTEVESLLAFEQSSEVLSGEPLVSIRPDEGWREGARIGPYRVVRRLGFGGMGAVYLAEQEGAVHRRVALKVIHRGMNTDEILYRFQVERQILAKLNHPFIARLLDAGATDDGRPYFAMDYVEGRPVDEYCDQEGLSLRERLELFRRVCDAVHFSHQNLVIHRDLKPGNILVTPDGTPRLLDFGIAKLLEPAQSLRNLTTVLGHQPMTPAYASPELVRHEPAGTASDVYSLGVLLYRLVTGRHPYDLGGSSGREVERIICEQEPRRPSTVVGPDAPPGSVPGTEARKLGRELAGDLDCILAKALRKEARERYGSVEQFSEDLRRHLDGLPVSARAGTFRYRAGKLARRHRLALATTAAFFLLATAFVAALAFQLGRIRLERNRANMSHDLFVEIVENTDPREQGDNLAPDEIVRRGVDLFGASFARERAVQASVFDSLGRVYRERGYYESARALLEEALETRLATLGEGHFLVAESRLNLAQLLGETGEYESAARLSAQGLLVQRRHYGGSHPELAKGISNHATQLYGLRRFEEAIALYREALEMKLALYGDVHLSVATSLATLGNAYRALGDVEPARRSYERSLEIRRELLPAGHPKLGYSYSQLGTFLHERGAYGEAEPLLRRALDIRRKALGEEHPTVAGSLYKLALVLQRLGRIEEAEAPFRRALEIRCGALGEAHSDCAAVKSSLAKLLVSRGECAVAGELVAEAHEVFLEKGPPWRVAVVEGIRGECLALEGSYEEAEALMLQSLATLRESLGEASIVTRDAEKRLADLYQVRSRPAALAATTEASRH